LLIAVVVHPADVQDRDGAKLVLQRFGRDVEAATAHLGRRWLRRATDRLGRLLRKRNPVAVEIVRRSDDVKGFKVLLRRWVVERTFGWLGRQGRLSKDYEYLTDTSETMIYVSMIGLMLRRLARGAF
jgi:putative transposase